MNITRLFPAAAIAVGLLVSPAFAKGNGAQAFVDKAAVAGMFEVQASELAIKVSKDPDVRKFADMMISDHSKAGAELEALAEEQGFKVPSKLDKEHAAKLKELEDAGGQFDAPYIKAQLEGHQAAVKLFEAYSNSGENHALQNFAVQTLPTLRMHLDTIEEMGDRVGATK